MKRRVKVGKRPPGLTLQSLVALVYEGAPERVTKEYLITLTTRGYEILVSFGVRHIVEFFRQNVSPYEWSLEQLVWDVAQFQMRETFWKKLATEGLPRGWGQPLRALWRIRRDAGLEPSLDPEAYLRFLLARNPEALNQFKNMRLGNQIDLGDELPILEFADADKLKLALETFVLGGAFWIEIQMIAEGYIPWMSANDPESVLWECRSAGLDLQDSRILEAGCGRATLIKDIATQFPDADCVGIDGQPHPLEFARQEGLPPNLVLTHKAIANYHAPCFDLIFIGSVSGGLTKKGLGHFLFHAHRLLNVGGHLVIYPQDGSPRGTSRIFQKVDDYRFTEV